MSAAPILTSLLDFRRLDSLATGDSALHRLDARAKVLVTLAFVVCVMSFGRHAVAPLLAFFVYPLALVAMARLPAAFLARKVAFVLPLALVIALPNPLFDREVLLRLGSLEVSGGWLSMLSIVLRSLLAAAAALVLVALTGFPAVCDALGRMGVPRPLVVQLLLLYRYLTVLGEEALRMTTARELRSGGRPLSMTLYGHLVGGWLLRTWERAERIHLAMCARGFSGSFDSGRASRWGGPEFAYLLGWGAVFGLLRTQDLAQDLGQILLGAIR